MLSDQIVHWNKVELFFKGTLYLTVYWDKGSWMGVGEEEGVRSQNQLMTN